MDAPRPDSNATIEPLLLQFPTEIAVNYLARLGLRTLISCELTCKYLRSVISESIELQYYKELLASQRHESTLVRRFPFPERLQLLRTSEASWRFLRPLSLNALNLRADGVPLSQDIRSESDSAFLAHGRLFSPWFCEDTDQDDDDDEGDFGKEVFDDILCLASACLRPVFTQKKKSRGLDARQSGLDSVTVTSCPGLRTYLAPEYRTEIVHSQDLLVVLEFADPQTIYDADPVGFPAFVHIRSLSTGAPHPLAASGRIEVNVGQKSRVVCFFGVAGPHVFILSPSERPSSSSVNALSVINWISGIVHTVHLDPCARYGEHLAVLNMNTVLVLLEEPQPSVEIIRVRFPDDGDEQDNSGVTTTTTRFLLPALQTPFSLAYLAGLSSHGVHLPDEEIINFSAERFPRDPAGDVFLLRVSYRGFDGGGRHGPYDFEHLPLVMFVIGIQRIIDLSEQRGIKRGADTGTLDPVDIPWSEWGPRCTRLFPYDQFYDEVTVHGSRLIRHDTDPGVEILDFNPFAGRNTSFPRPADVLGGKAKAEGKNGLLLAEYVDEPNDFPEDLAALCESSEVTVTGLPYWRVKREVGASWAAALANNTCIVTNVHGRTNYVGEVYWMG